MTQHTSKRRILILGGGYAGLMAAARSARAGSTAEITLVNASPDFVQRIRLHEALAGSTPRSFSIPQLLARRGVRFVQGFVDQLKPERQQVQGRDSAGGNFTLGYDELILALGSHTTMPSPEIAAHTVQLDKLPVVTEAAGQLRELAARAGRVLIVGGGLTGIETATELAERYPTLRVGLTTSGRLGENYSANGERYVRQRFAQLGIQIWEQTAITQVEQGRAWSADGTALPCDLCVWCGGFAAPSILSQSGLAVDGYGRVVVDEMLRVVDQPHIFAIGDAAAVSVNGKPIRMSCASALPMGGHMGNNIRRLVRGQELEPFSMGFAARCVSLGRRDALVQWVAPDDQAKPSVWTNRRAVYTKELICRATFTVVSQELKLGLPLYGWSKAPAQTQPSQRSHPAQEPSA
ncbi:MAG: FAD-dependent oxidoreductase [Chloroflexi bacterium]|nr:FAD-dependent oxidoreductase [Chloroflexota bacterium]